MSKGKGPTESGLEEDPEETPPYDDQIEHRLVPVDAAGQPAPQSR
jgi:hypothetical protein